MAVSPKNKLEKQRVAQFQEHYFDIINSVPDAVYWTDTQCNLIGCNKNFLKLMGLKSVQDLVTTPYQLMTNHAHWSAKRVEELKLDDMNSLCAAQARYEVEEKPIIDAKQKKIFFKSTRVPMLEDKKVKGLIVVLTDITSIIQLKENKKRFSSKDAASSSQNAVLSRSSKVLMVEDNLIAQNVERALLTALNCQVDIADTGNKAIELFNPGKYDLVFMDIDLEDTSGYLVAKQFRSKEERTRFHVPIIALTGYEADMGKKDGEHYFMDGAITKPLTSEQAEKIIKHYVYQMSEITIPGLKRI